MSSLTSAADRPLAGSSSISSDGRAMSARAMITRFWTPCGSAPGYACALSATPRSARACIASSRTDVMRRSALGRPSASAPTRDRDGAPAITFSRTVSAGQSPRPCRVRAIPMCASRHAGSASRDRPWYLIVPATGVTNLDTALKSVVLPAPLGPMTPTIWFARTARETPSRATTPSKCTSTPATSRTTGVAPGD